MAGGLVVACFRLHGLYSGGAAEHVNPVWPILFIVGDGFMLVSVLALAVTQATQVPPTLLLGSCVLAAELLCVDCSETAHSQHFVATAVAAMGVNYAHTLLNIC